MPVDEAAVATQLHGWRAAHTRYQQAEARMEADGGQVIFVPADPVARHQALQEARDARLAAHALDPQHSAPAWRHHDRESGMHEQLMEFYRGQLG